MRGRLWFFQQNLPAVRSPRKPFAAHGIDCAFIEPNLFALAESQANLIIDVRVHRWRQPSPLSLVVEIFNSNSRMSEWPSTSEQEKLLLPNPLVEVDRGGRYVLPAFVWNQRLKFKCVSFSPTKGQASMKLLGEDYSNELL